MWAVGVIIATMVRVEDKVLVQQRLMKTSLRNSRGVAVLNQASWEARKSRIASLKSERALYGEGCIEPLIFQDVRFIGLTLLHYSGCCVLCLFSLTAPF